MAKTMKAPIAMKGAQLVDFKGRMLNHIEMIYRPGERSLVGKVFQALGCGVIETGGTYLLLPIGPGETDSLNNIAYASEVTKEQWAFEQELAKQLKTNPALSAAYKGYDQKFRKEPQLTTHFGIRYPSFAKLEAQLQHIRTGLPPEIRGRLEICSVFRPGDPGSLSNTIIQAFVKTDVVVAGLLTLGQHIELQAQQLE
ncbi:MAG: hypothetical protein HY261_09390 [Chloroflexi bacterium]|nr:hypothetical protein [Chloroflexota bacterium]